jgi:hypothetical protein
LTAKRCQIIYCLKNYNAPFKLIRLVVTTLQNMKASVKINGELSEGFQISCGVKQGDPLSASLFILDTDEIIHDLRCSDVNIEQVSHYKYLGSIVNSDNTTEQEIKERLAIGNKVYAAHSTLFKSKLFLNQLN